MRRSVPVLLVVAALALTGCSRSVVGEAHAAPEPPAPGEPVSEFCQSVTDTVEPGNRLSAWVNGGPATDAEVDETIAELRPAVDRVRLTAPPEIADDVNTTADVTATVLTSLGTTHDPQATMNDPGVVFAVLRAGDAPRNVREYARADCGVDLVFLPGS